jgi:hypothetical protein
MGRPRKTLFDLVVDGTFLARRHSQLLVDEPLVDEPALRRLQERYCGEQSGLERQARELRFEKIVRGVPGTASLDDGDEVVVAAPMRLTREYQLAELAELLNLPPVPLQIAHDLRVCHRFWRAMRGRVLLDADDAVAAIAERLGVSRTTVRRDLGWLQQWECAAPA